MLQIVIEQCDMAIRTVDIQLVRVEMCGDAAAYTKDGESGFTACTDHLHH